MGEILDHIAWIKKSLIIVWDIDQMKPLSATVVALKGFIWSISHIITTCY